MKKILFLALVFVSCSDFTNEPIIQIDPIAKTTYGKFLSLGKSYGMDFSQTSIIIEVGEIPSGKYGLTFYESILRIRINKDYILSITSQLNQFQQDQSPKFYLEYTIMHELGHALLRREHVNSLKLSIMTCCMETAWFYTMDDKRPLLEKELFQP